MLAGRYLILFRDVGFIDTAKVANPASESAENERFVVPALIFEGIAGHMITSLTQTADESLRFGLAPHPNHHST